ncbi:hypothetical protein, partial [Alistipes communis]|uniref:hypothetical protein n=1 Tax=Alistipes communis TaxID=2585118 RepID=UPI003FD8B972
RRDDRHRDCSVGCVPTRNRRRFRAPAIENRFERKFEVVFLRKKLHNLHGFYIFACILLQTASGMGYVERRQTERDEINAQQFLITN